MKSSEVRVLIADDSGFMQLLIKNILSSEKSIKVVGTAENGKEAHMQTVDLKPDVVLMDMIMPKYDGLYGINAIMEECPTPIVILSSIGNTDINPIVNGMEIGAFDYINKPDKNSAKLRSIDSEIVRKVRQAARADINKLTKTRLTKNDLPHHFADDVQYDIIVMGSSTGGPPVLEQILTKFPRNLTFPVLIAQHMPQNFISSFANRLDQLIPHDVEVAKRGSVVEGGKIYVASGDKNMIVRKNGATGKVVVDFVNDKFDEYNNPSVNSLMSSVAKVYGKRSISVLLTRMGRDGAKGMQDIHKKGGYTIAQDRASSVVYGMPKEAIESGCIKRVLPADEIGEYIISCLS